MKKIIPLLLLAAMCAGMTSCSQNQDNEGVRRIDGIENFRPRRECKFEEIAFGKLYFKICEILYACGVLRRACARFDSAACESMSESPRRARGLDISRADISRHKLSVCTCHKHTALVFCGYRRCKQRRNSHKRFKLS